jgi:hypothetical protein
MDSTQHNNRPIDLPCRLCGAPAAMTCADWYGVRQVNAAFDLIERSTSPEELSAEDRMGWIGIPEVSAS